MNISINDLNFKYKDKIIFKNLNLNILKNKVTVILGKNGSGKTTLRKLLTGELSSKDKIKYDDEILNKNTMPQIIKKISILSCKDNIDKIVLEYLTSILEDILCDKKEVKIKLIGIIEEFNLNEVIDKNYNNLNYNQKMLVDLAAISLIKPKILILDEPFSNMDALEKDKILSLISNLKDNTTIIYFTCNMEDTLIGDEICVIGNNKILLKGNKEEFYDNEKELNQLGFKLPFMVELSNRLKFYNLIDETIYDMQKMVDTLWQ